MPIARAYFDICALKRCWDDQSQLRVRLEAEAVNVLLQLVRLRKLTFLRSDILAIENATNPRPDRRAAVDELLASHPIVAINDRMLEARAHWLVKLGLGVMDAAHLAAAEQLKADVLVTTDKRFIRRASRRTGTRVVGPIEYAMEIL